MLLHIANITLHGCYVKFGCENYICYIWLADGRSPGERVGREGHVELDRLGLAEEGLRLGIRGPLRIFHHFTQPSQGFAGLIGLRQAVLGQGQEGQVGRSSLLVYAFVRVRVARASAISPQRYCATPKVLR